MCIGCVCSFPLICQKIKGFDPRMKSEAERDQDQDVDLVQGAVWIRISPYVNVWLNHVHIN